MVKKQEAKEALFRQPTTLGMEGYHRQPLPPTGVSHALSVRLTQDSYNPNATVVSHLITARQSLIQVWEVREHALQEGKVRLHFRGLPLLRVLTDPFGMMSRVKRRCTTC